MVWQQKLEVNPEISNDDVGRNHPLICKAVIPLVSTVLRNLSYNGEESLEITELVQLRSVDTNLDTCTFDIHAELRDPLLKIVAGLRQPLDDSGAL
jgi:hypothetical protein